MDEIEKLRNDRMFLIAVINDLSQALRENGKILAGDRKLFALPGEDDVSEYSTVGELLEAWVAEREDGKVPG